MRSTRKVSIISRTGDFGEVFHFLLLLENEFILAIPSDVIVDAVIVLINILISFLKMFCCTQVVVERNKKY